MQFFQRNKVDAPFAQLTTTAFPALPFSSKRPKTGLK
jgi:hypothetical protein